jgi:hypothetical protein
MKNWKKIFIKKGMAEISELPLNANVEGANRIIYKKQG